MDVFPPSGSNKVTFFWRNETARIGLGTSSTYSDTSAVNPGTPAFNHFFTPFRVLGSLVGAEVWLEHLSLAVARTLQGTCSPSPPCLLSSLASSSSPFFLTNHSILTIPLGFVNVAYECTSPTCSSYFDGFRSVHWRFLNTFLKPMNGDGEHAAPSGPNYRY